MRAKTECGLVTLSPSFKVEEPSAQPVKPARPDFPRLSALPTLCGLLVYTLAPSSQAAPPLLNPITATNQLAVDPFDSAIRYGGTWGDDGSAGSPTYSRNYYHTFLGISGYAYNGTGDDPDCNALGQWSPFTCPGISFNDTSPLVVPNGQIE